MVDTTKMYPIGAPHAGHDYSRNNIDYTLSHAEEVKWLRLCYHVRGKSSLWIHAIPYGVPGTYESCFHVMKCKAGINPAATAMHAQQNIIMSLPYMCGSIHSPNTHRVPTTAAATSQSWESPRLRLIWWTSSSDMSATCSTVSKTTHGSTRPPRHDLASFRGG